MAISDLAVAPTNPVPGLHLTVDLLHGPNAAGTAGLKMALLAPQSTAGGDITANTEKRVVTGADAVKTAAGQGSLAHLAYVAAFANDPQLQCTLVCPAESGGNAATETVTAGGSLTADGTARFWIQGRQIDVAWLVGEDPDDFKAKAVTAINAYSDVLPVTASAGSGTGEVDFTFRTKGPCGNDCTLRVELIDGAGGTLSAGAAKLSGGTTEPDFSTAYSTIADDEFDFIVAALSNAVVITAGAGDHVDLKTHITGNDSGLNAALQQGVIASTGTIAQAKTGATHLNSEVIEHVHCTNGESLPCEFAAAEAAGRMAQRRLRSNYNRIGVQVLGVYGSADPAADQPTEAESIDALNNGVSLLAYNNAGEVVVRRAITTRYQDSSGAQDRRAYDVNEVCAVYDVAKDLRSALPLEFQGAKVTRDLAEGDEEPPAGVVEEQDIREFIDARILQIWVPNGTINSTQYRAAIENGTRVVEVNSTDETQVDIFLPLVPFKILAKIGLFVAKVG